MVSRTATGAHRVSGKATAVASVSPGSRITGLLAVAGAVLTAHVGAARARQGRQVPTGAGWLTVQEHQAARVRLSRSPPGVAPQAARRRRGVLPRSSPAGAAPARRSCRRRWTASGWRPRRPRRCARCSRRCTRPSRAAGATCAPGPACCCARGCATRRAPARHPLFKSLSIDHPDTLRLIQHVYTMLCCTRLMSTRSPCPQPAYGQATRASRARASRPVGAAPRARPAAAMSHTGRKPLGGSLSFAPHGLSFPCAPRVYVPYAIPYNPTGALGPGAGDEGGGGVPGAGAGRRRRARRARAGRPRRWAGRRAQHAGRLLAALHLTAQGSKGMHWDRKAAVSQSEGGAGLHRPGLMTSLLRLVPALLRGRACC